MGGGTARTALVPGGRLLQWTPTMRQAPRYLGLAGAANFFFLSPANPSQVLYRKYGVRTAGMESSRHLGWTGGSRVRVLGAWY